jgi:hypothetical protein
MSKKMMKNLPKWCQQKWKKEDHSCCTQSQPKRKEEIMSHHNKLVHWKVWLADWWVQLLSSQKLWHTQKWNHGMILRQFDQRICNQQETKEWRQIILTIYIKFGEYD